VKEYDKNKKKKIEELKQKIVAACKGSKYVGKLEIIGYIRDK